MKLSTAMLAAALALGLATPAHGEVTVYRDQAAYLSAAGGTAGVVTFDGGPATAEWVSGNQWSGVHLTLCGSPGPPCELSQSGVLWEGSALVYQPVSTIVTLLFGGFPPPPPYTSSVAQAFAFELSGDTTGTFLSLSVGGTRERLSLDGTVGFVGVVTSEPIISFGLGKSGDNPAYGSSFALETLYLPPAIPEPATAWLALLGLMLLAWHRRREAP